MLLWAHLNTLYKLITSVLVRICDGRVNWTSYDDALKKEITTPLTSRTAPFDSENSERDHVWYKRCNKLARLGMNALFPPCKCIYTNTRALFWLAVSFGGRCNAKKLVSGVLVSAQLKPRGRAEGERRVQVSWTLTTLY